MVGWINSKSQIGIGGTKEGAGMTWMPKECVNNPPPLGDWVKNFAISNNAHLLIFLALIFVLCFLRHVTTICLLFCYTTANFTTIASVWEASRMQCIPTMYKNKHNTDNFWWGLWLFSEFPYHLISILFHFRRFEYIYYLWFPWIGPPYSKLPSSAQTG